MPYHSAYLLPFESLDIVVVDDSQPMRHIYQSIILSFGVKRLRLFSGGQDALNEMVNDPPNLLITDWRMKPMDGYELLKTIRRSDMMPLSLLPVIMVTGYASRHFVQKCFDAGVQQFLVKPVSPNTIFERIKWTLSDSRFLLAENDVYKLETHAEKEMRDRHASLELMMPKANLTKMADDLDESPKQVNDHWHI